MEGLVSEFPHTEDQEQVPILSDLGRSMGGERTRQSEGDCSSRNARGQSALGKSKFDESR